MDRRKSRPVRHLEWRVRVMGAGALLSLIGIYYEARWLVWVAIAVLVAGFLMRFLPEEGAEPTGASSVGRAALPNAERAVVPEEKVTRYLLSASHPDGRGKAIFFSSYGFWPSDWEVLAAALRRHAVEHPVAHEVETDFGIRYVVEGGLRAPDGRSPDVRSVWFTARGADVPRFVTAYPMERRS